MTVALNAYYAGFFDGEGTVDIRYRKTHNGKYERFEMRVQISQLETEPLTKAKELWGGSICLPKSTNVSRWLVSGREAIKFLIDVHPYVMVKKEEVEWALAFSNLMLSFKHNFNEGSKGFCKEPEEIRNMKIIYHHELRYAREKKGLAAKDRNTVPATRCVSSAS